MSGAMCWPAAACHSKRCQVATGTQGRVHRGHVLGLYLVQWLQVVWDANICHAYTLLNCKMSTPTGKE